MGFRLTTRLEFLDAAAKLGQILDLDPSDGRARFALGEIWLLRKRPKLSLELQGHADERGSSEYNLALGKRRVQAAKRFLVDLGVDPGRLGTTSYGEEYPAARGHNESAWAKNRRGVFAAR